MGGAARAVSVSVVCAGGAKAAAAPSGVAAAAGAEAGEEAPSGAGMRDPAVGDCETALLLMLAFSLMTVLMLSERNASPVQRNGTPWKRSACQV